MFLSISVALTREPNFILVILRIWRCKLDFSADLVYLKALIAHEPPQYHLGCRTIFGASLWLLDWLPERLQTFMPLAAV